MCFALYNLARNPDKQENLITEIQKVMELNKEEYDRDSAKMHLQTTGANKMAVNNDVSQHDIDKLPYLKACVKESFRLDYYTYMDI